MRTGTAFVNKSLSPWSSRSVKKQEDARLGSPKDLSSSLLFKFDVGQAKLLAGWRLLWLPTKKQVLRLGSDCVHPGLMFAKVKVRCYKTVIFCFLFKTDFGFFKKVYLLLFKLSAILNFVIQSRAPWATELGHNIFRLFLSFLKPIERNHSIFDISNMFLKSTGWPYHFLELWKIFNAGQVKAITFLQQSFVPSGHLIQSE